MLDVAKKDLKEYRYTELAIRDAYNDGAKRPASMGLISIEWLPSKEVFSRLVLNLETVMDAYTLLGRTHPRDLAMAVVQRVETALETVSVPWIQAWGDEVCRRDELAVLGIYARPELYEMSGPCRIETAKGVIDIGAALLCLNNCKR